MDDTHNTTLALIERYLEGKMEQKEKDLFEARWDQEPELARQVDFMLKAKLAGHAAGRDALKADLNQRFSPEAAKTVTPVRNMQFRRYASMAAAILFFFIAGYFLLRNANPLSTQEAYIAYAEFPSAREPKSGEKISPLRKAHLAYNQKEFNNAIEQYTAILKADTVQNRNESLYYLGLSQLQQENPVAAMGAFESIESQSEFGQEAEWFTAMANLQAGNLPEAKIILANIQENPKQFYQNKATELLSKLGP